MSRNLFIVAFLLFASVAGRADVIDEYHRTDAELADVRRELAERQQALDSIRDEREKLARKLSILDEEIEYHESLVSRTEADMDAAEEAKADLEAAIERTERRIVELTQAATGGNVYLVDNADWLAVRMLVFTRQLHRTVRNMEIIEMVNRNIADAVTELANAKTRLAALTEEREAAIDRLAELKRAQVAERQTVERKKLAHAQLMNVVAEDMEAARFYVDLLADRQEDLSRRLSRLAARIGVDHDDNRGDTFASRKGRLPWPVRGDVIQRFGKRRVEGFRGTVDVHGIRIEPTGAGIVDAVAPGTVAYVGVVRGLGTVVIVAHGKTHYSLYAGLSRADVVPGDPVDTHTPIGRLPVDLMGENPYLYFEIREKDTPVDPLAWLIPGGHQ